MKDDMYTFIGLEIHIQLKTQTKLLCSCANEENALPNSNICPICLGMPGTLPSINAKAVEFAVRLGAACECTIHPVSVFARKNYFYPDLPKGYQITQYNHPICTNGKFQFFDSNGKPREISIRRIHIEEDAAKSIHISDKSGTKTIIDHNRCGIPLLEMVTEPQFKDPEDVENFVRMLQITCRYLEISDANMEKGNLRVDANVSVNSQAELPSYKTEIKNINSTRFLKQALKAAIELQEHLLQSGKVPDSRTVSWDEKGNQLIVLRGKEAEEEYKYFPEPDLLPLELKTDLIQKWKLSNPELPFTKINRFMQEYHLKYEDAVLLCEDRKNAEFFEEIVQKGIPPKEAARWINIECRRIQNKYHNSINFFPFAEDEFVELLRLLQKGKINQNSARELLEALYTSKKSLKQLLEEMNIYQIANKDEINKMVDAVLQQYPNVVKQFQNGEKKVLGFLIGQVMRKSNGRANPYMVKKFLEEKLKLK